MATSGKPAAKRKERTTLDFRLPQLETVRLYRQIADLLADGIDKGTFPVGSLLPAERDLAQHFGVSRTSVREALIALEVRGKVSIRVGHGVQILEATPRTDHLAAGAVDGDADIGPIQLMEARLVIEPRTAELAATKRDEASLGRMRQAMEKQARAKSVRAPEYRDYDREFHLEIARAAGNAALTLVIASLWDYPRKPMFEKFEELLMGAERLHKTADEHRHIFEAIERGDRVAARQAMKAHLGAVLHAFVRGLGTN